jgi:Flp pilus assembly protein TadG
MTTKLADVAKLQAPTTEHAQSQKGNVLVEFALILPVFALLLFGMISFSVALYNKTVLTMASREGARAGAKYVAGQADNTSRITNAKAATTLATNSLISFGSVTSAPPSATIVNDILTVKANYDYTGLYIFSNPLKISAQTSMRLE